MNPAIYSGVMYSVLCTLYKDWRPLDSPDEAVAWELQTGVGEDSLRPGEEGGIKGGKIPVRAFYPPSQHNVNW